MRDFIPHNSHIPEVHPLKLFFDNSQFRKSQKDQEIANPILASRLTLEHKRTHARKREKARENKLTFSAPFHQTPFRRIALLFAARTRDSKVSLLADFQYDADFAHVDRPSSFTHIFIPHDNIHVTRLEHVHVTSYAEEQGTLLIVQLLI